MKKRLRLLAWMLTLTMLCELLPFGAFAQSDVGQQLALAAAQSLEEENGEATIIGKCGDNLQWSLSSDGVLTIDGTGEMDDYVYVHGSVDRPWSDYLSDIKTVVISSNTTHIGNFAFWNCIYLHSVILPESIVSIGSSAFSACESLTSIDIPASVNSIQSDTFSYCKKLASITIPSSVTSIGSSAFECCTSLATINIPDSVTSIGEHAFDSCSSLTSIDIPKSVIFIGEDAFSSTSLSVIDIPESVTSIEPFTFRDCIVLASVHLPSSLVSIGAEAFTSCSALSSVNIPNGVKSIGENAFSECTSLNSITIPSSVTSLGELVFAGCTSLTSISLPDSIGSIPPRAFDSCSNLTSVNISSGITTIGGRAFYDCISLSSITIPDSVTSIESEAFTGCSFLSSITLPRFITSIDAGVFSFCTNLKSITIPDEVTSIGQYSFWNCTSLTSIILPPFVDSIYHDAFNNCSSLISITIPSSLRFIDYYAFNNCSSLQDVYYAGTSEEWNKISISDRNDCNDDLLNATIHYQSAEPEDEKEFTFGRDNLSFLNTKKYFCEQDRTPLESFFGWMTNKYIDAGHPVSDEKFDLLTKNYVPRVKTALDFCRSDSWGGSCFGMSAVAAIHYVSPYKLPFSAATTYNLAAPVNDKSVQDLINYYHILQYTPTLRKVLLDRGAFCINHFEEPLSEITTELRSGFPVLVSLHSPNSYHEILLLNILEETHEYYTIRVYDPNEPNEKTLYLHKFRAETTETESDFLPISYGDYDCIQSYILSKSDLNFLDLRNFYEIGDNETATDYDKNFVIVNSDYSLTFKWGRAYYRASNGKLVEFSDNITVIPDGSAMADGTYAGNLWISVPTPTDGSDFTLETSSSDTGLTSLLLNDTLLSISTSGPVELTYNEADRTVDVTAEAPTDVNLLMTKNDVDESWPWHSWALDTTGTTTLHADLDDDGLHLSGDGITNAKYATENADTENVDSGTISVQPDADGITTVTITNKKSSFGDSLEIVTPSAPTTGNAITVTNGFAYIDDPEQPVNSAALGDVVTIVANDRSSEGKTFTGWVVNSGDVTLNDSSASPTSFTMGDKAVSITAQYSTNSTPTPTPGGGSSSGGGGGGGGGGGAAVLIGVGAAAAITAGVIMMSPVEIKGRVVLADQAAVPGAKLSLLHEGKVVAQTTADENGSFSLKAKRGSYELTAAYTTADGQLIYKTIDIKAPAKDLTVTF